MRRLSLRFAHCSPLDREGDFAGVCQGLHNPLGGKDQAEGEANGRQQDPDGDQLPLHQVASQAIQGEQGQVHC